MALYLSLQIVELHRKNYYDRDKMKSLFHWKTILCLPLATIIKQACHLLWNTSSQGHEWCLGNNFSSTNRRNTFAQGISIHSKLIRIHQQNTTGLLSFPYCNLSWCFWTLPCHTLEWPNGLLCMNLPSQLQKYSKVNLKSHVLEHQGIM